MCSGKSSMIQGNAMISRQIINNLKTVQNEASVYSAQLNEFVQKLKDVQSFQELHQLVEAIARKNKEIYTFLFNQLGGANKETKEAVNAYVTAHPNMSDFMNVLNFNEQIRDKIISAKERLSTREMLFNLPTQEQAAVELFIDKIKALKPVAQELEAQKAAFRKQLSETNSVQTVDEIEQQIAAQDAAYHLVYNSFVTYPSNKNTVNNLIPFLEKNQHLLNIIRAFDFEESLTDDVMSARATKNTSFSKG